MTENVLIGLTAAGFGVSAGAAAVPLLKRFRRLTNTRATKTEKIPVAVQRFITAKTTDDLPLWLRRWLAKSLYNLERSGFNWSPVRYAAFIIFGTLTGFVIGVTFLQNLPAAFLIAATAYLVPEQLVARRLQAKKFRKIEQLGAAIRVFAAEYADTPQVPRAIAAVAKRSPDPLGAVFREAERLIATGRSPEEVCAYLLKELDFEYGRMFVQLLRVAWNDAAAKALFSRLAARVSGIQKLVKKNMSSLAYSRSMSIIINAMILPAVAGISLLVPETGEFLLRHPIGRLLVCMVFLSVLMGLLLDKALNEVEA